MIKTYTTDKTKRSTTGDWTHSLNLGTRRSREYKSIFAHLIEG